MDKVIEKIAFNFLIGQLAPALFLIAALKFLFEISPHTSIVEALTAVIAWMNNSTTFLAVLTASIPIGLFLWAIQTIAAANRESFRLTYLDSHGKWVRKSALDIRKRGYLRKTMANLWMSGHLALMILLAPLILTFDILSTLSARTRDLYKFIAVLRSPKVENEIYLAVINDFNFSSTYFGNMSISLLIVTAVAIGSARRPDVSYLVLIVGFYLVCGAHYLFGRLLKTAFDRSVDPSEVGAATPPAG